MPFHGNSTELDAHRITRALVVVDALYLRESAVNELSGGERALVFLGRAWAGDPALLSSDEPAAGLDPYRQMRLAQIKLVRDLVLTEIRKK